MVTRYIRDPEAVLIIRTLMVIRNTLIVNTATANMKKLVIVFIVLAAIGFAGYGYVSYRYTDKQGVIHFPSDTYSIYQLRNGEVPVVTAYLKKNINDLDSYESIDWGELKQEGTDDRGKPLYIVQHSFRAANGFGAKRLADLYFEIDHLGFVTKAMTLDEYSEQKVHRTMMEAARKEGQRVLKEYEDKQKAAKKNKATQPKN